MKISLITTCYNSATTINDTINSVLSQQYPDIEHIIIDGASTDETANIVQSYKNKVQKFISEPDKGIYNAMNKGLRLATGDVVGIINSDDFYADDMVVSRVMEIFKEENIDSVYGDLQYVDAKQTDKIVRHWIAGSFRKKNFLNGWMPPHPTFFVRRQCYESYGLFDESFSNSADYELMLRFLYKHQISTQYIPEVLIKMRTGGASNASIHHRLRANKEDRLAWKKNGLQPRLYTSILKPLRKIGQFVFK